MIEVTHNAAQQLKLSLGGIVLSLVTDNGLGLTVPQTHKAFLVSEGEPDITLRAEFGAIPPMELEEEIFRTSGAWGLYRSRDKLVLHFCAWELETTPYKIAVMEPDFRAGTIRSRVKESGQKNYFNPLNYPLDELASNKSLEDKNQTLKHWLQERVSCKSVRFYAEPTVVFDEL